MKVLPIIDSTTDIFDSKSLLVTSDVFVSLNKKLRCAFGIHISSINFSLFRGLSVNDFLFVAFTFVQI